MGLCHCSPSLLALGRFGALSVAARLPDGILSGWHLAWSGGGVRGDWSRVKVRYRVLGGKGRLKSGLGCQDSEEAGSGREA